jgi:hypothetical protein
MSYIVECFGITPDADTVAHRRCERRLDESSTFWFNPKTPP